MLLYFTPCKVKLVVAVTLSRLSDYFGLVEESLDFNCGPTNISQTL